MVRKFYLTISNFSFGENFTVKPDIILSICPLVKPTCWWLPDRQQLSKPVSSDHFSYLWTACWDNKIREILKLEGIGRVQKQRRLKLDQVVLGLVANKFECFQTWIQHGTLSICLQWLLALSRRNIHKYLFFLMLECITIQNCQIMEVFKARLDGALSNLI